METAVFTIYKTDGELNIVSSRFNSYNKYGVKEKDLFSVMSELSDTFNNVIGIGIMFDVE